MHVLLLISEGPTEIWGSDSRFVHFNVPLVSCPFFQLTTLLFTDRRYMTGENHIIDCTSNCGATTRSRYLYDKIVFPRCEA
jgi:hypothetical protein